MSNLIVCLEIVRGCSPEQFLNNPEKEETAMDGATATDSDVMLQDVPETTVSASDNQCDEDDKSLENKEKRFTLRLSSEAVETLDWISERRSKASYQEVIRRALGTEMFLLKLIEDGASIIVEKEGSRPKEIVFR